MNDKDVLQALATVFTELLDGSKAKECWVLNPQDPGLMKTLDNLPAAQASAVPVQGGASVAAHADHLRYGLGLLNRWTQGERPFADADYSASWERITVSETEWAARREALRAEASRWRDAITNPRELTEFEMTGMIASVVHLAYHFGAMRQIDRSMRGPSA
ncbi:MAG: DinB family protein [Bryobacteraceae bacterium]